MKRPPYQHTEKKPQRRILNSGLGPAVMTKMIQTPGKEWTAETLADALRDAFPHITKNSVNTALGDLHDGSADYGQPVRGKIHRVRYGTYVYAESYEPTHHTPAPAPAPATGDEALLVNVLAVDADGRLIVQDDTTRAIYRMEKLA